MFFVILVDDVYCVAIHDLHLYSQRCFHLNLGDLTVNTGLLPSVNTGLLPSVNTSVVAVSQHIRCWKLLPSVNTSLKKLTRALTLVTMVFSAVFCVYETLELPWKLTKIKKISYGFGIVVSFYKSVMFSLVN